MVWAKELRCYQRRKYAEAKDSLHAVCSSGDSLGILHHQDDIIEITIC